MSSLFLIPSFLNETDRKNTLAEILNYHPIWENRFSKSNPPPVGQNQRSLLRPVYWLGNWQFACLNYYHPPKGILNRCVQAEPYHLELSKVVKRIETEVRKRVPTKEVPQLWKLNTCLINYYGSKIVDGKKIDAARVGEHKDFEPGPVASLSFGDRALFQFVSSAGRAAPSRVIMQQWLNDNTLQVFAGPRYKDQLFHRVQRVEKKVWGEQSPIEIENFKTRRINLTFRYVPEEHIQEINQFPSNLKSDVAPYIQKLANGSSYWSKVHESLSKTMDISPS